eukprot:CAMPEP_0181239920 /NCGR_PEP_ID=MMETSP1096-20121128/40222_1 /TAXON_ID=156174 ORGANISM="Chrysochromulina ericina, Strain CCMP281" /NCGR_SAMPLE_ID=MMETSP1096 /ASSEMBLY_ACC=CAM_ASM_000453 /LENGTH=158 /DNA_ID=CAMNT_0023335711 /DNA_START=387 /DNA_END=864 /DNA_ORIENTATION=+
MSKLVTSGGHQQPRPLNRRDGRRSRSGVSRLQRLVHRPGRGDARRPEVKLPHSGRERPINRRPDGTLTVCDMRLEARTQAAAAQIDHRGWCGRSAAAAAATGDEDLRLRECAGSCVNRGVHDAEVSAHALCTLAQGCATGLGRRKRVVRVGYGVVCGG